MTQLGNVEQMLQALATANQGIATGAGNQQAKLQAATQGGIASQQNATQLALQQMQGDQFADLNLSKERIAAQGEEAATGRAVLGAATGLVQQERGIKASDEQIQQQHDNAVKLMDVEAEMLKDRQEFGIKLEMATNEALLAANEEAEQAGRERARQLMQQRDEIDLAVAALGIQIQSATAERPILTERFVKHLSDYTVARATAKSDAITRGSASVADMLEDELSNADSYLAKVGLRAREGGFSSLTPIGEDIMLSAINWLLPEDQQQLGSRILEVPLVLRNSIAIANLTADRLGEAFAAHAKGDKTQMQAAIKEWIGTGLAASRAFSDPEFQSDQDRLVTRFEDATVGLRNFLPDEMVQGLIEVVAGGSDGQFGVIPDMLQTAARGEAIGGSQLKLSPAEQKLAKESARDFRRIGDVFRMIRNKQGSKLGGFDPEQPLTEIPARLVGALADAAATPQDFERLLKEHLKLSPSDARLILQQHQDTLARLAEINPAKFEAQREALSRAEKKVGREEEEFRRRQSFLTEQAGLEAENRALEALIRE